ncbi:MAG: agmatinase [Candidatus Omnitrophica bacterium]|nr:agmatinase [Candidatus Omnitrophota bacterium]MBU4149844.1 agmatinase [Candidatus Omnitrophota bacterium]
MNMIFGGSDNKMNSFENSKAVIVPVPYGKTVTYRPGTENGPRAILEASDKMELFDEELGREIYKMGINTAPSIKVDGLDPEAMVNAVEKKIDDIFEKKKMPVVIGGEHSVSVGAVRAAKKRYQDLSILYFDAHHDIRDRYNGSKFNHACIARRLLEITPLVEVGVRSLSMAEFDFLAGKDIKIVSMQYIKKDPDWLDSIKDYLSDHVYISIDLDVFDPSIMPSVGTPEPGGMLWYEFLQAVRGIIQGKKIVGFDVVELCPIKDMIGPDFMAAKLIYKLLGYIFP